MLKMEEFVNKDIIDLFKNTIILNSNDDPKKEEGNPTEMAILKYIDQNDIDVVEYREKYKRLFSAPFSSDRKRMSTVVEVDGQAYVFLKGASE